MATLVHPWWFRWETKARDSSDRAQALGLSPLLHSLCVSSVHTAGATAECGIQALSGWGWPGPVRVMGGHALALSGLGRGVGAGIPEPRPGSWYAGSNEQHIFTFGGNS